MNNADPVSITLQAWADRELSGWRRRGLRRIDVERHIHEAAARRPDVRLYRFADGRVTQQPMHPDAPGDDEHTFRAGLYLRLFESVLPLLPPGLRTTICVGVEDRVLLPLTVPVFGFQRAKHEPTALLPDIDMLLNNFHEDEVFHDRVPYVDKIPCAVFTGSTTGSMIDLECARTFATPRLRAAKFFEGNPDVDFRLPGIAQCTEEAKRFLERQRFCQASRLSWSDQFRSRFLISMDGNGATCSRVAIALASHGVLLKYNSDHTLYYFNALVPNEHFLPVEKDADVLAVIAREHADPWSYADIPKAANAFVARYLTRGRVMEYTARLIASYAEMLDDAAEALSPASAQRLA